MCFLVVVQFNLSTSDEPPKKKLKNGNGVYTNGK